MKIPLSWLEEFADIPKNITLEEIDQAFVQVGFEVESITRTGRGIAGPLVVAAVLKIEELEGNKKRIRYVELDCGEPKTRFVICGAQNFKVGDLVIAALPGAVLPGDFKISARETYGKISDGMICSSKELALSDEHSGIIVLAPNSAEPGNDAKALLEIEDVILDVSVNPDRGYALSIRGLARELAASLGVSYKDPISTIDAKIFAPSSAGVAVEVQDRSALSVIYIRTITNFNTQSRTPIWMSRRIEKCGMRPISLAVDVTNYVMLELGQPLHAFDAAKIAGKLIIKSAGEGKTLTTLDGLQRKLDASDLVVADEKSSLALAGVMGGASSEVTSETSTVALEAARFDPTRIAKNARRHKLSSEASRRFERGVDPSLAEIASARAIDLMIELGGATYLGSSSFGEAIYAPVVALDPAFISKYLGFEVSHKEIEAKLKLVGCDISKNNNNDWKIKPPTWRADLLRAPDLVEEVARMIGYDRIPSTLPVGKNGSELSGMQSRRRTFANFLASNGFSEVYNSPFVNPVFLSELGFDGDRAKAFRLANPMSEEFPDLRTHLLPGLFLAALRNQGRGAKDIALFELGSVFRNTEKLGKIAEITTENAPDEKIRDLIYKSVPNQPLHIGGLVAGKLGSDSWNSAGTDFTWLQALGFARSLIELTGVVPEVFASDFAPWHPGRCAEFRVKNRAVAHAGELHPRVLAKLGLPERSCAFVVVMSALDFEPPKVMTTLITMPAATQDISLLVDADVPASKVEAALREGAGDLLESISLFDRYDKLDGGKISLAFTMVFRALDRTLTAEEVTKFRNSAALSAEKNCGATARG